MQIPDSIRPAVDILVKYHFWMLAAVVPLIVSMLSSLAARDLLQTIQSKQSAIDSKLESVRSVQGTAEHPNEGWVELIARDTVQVKRDTLAEWRRFYDEQAPIRVWPASLGEDFVERASKLQPGGRLPRSLLERYQDTAKNIVRTLPGRLGAEDAMPGGADGDAGPRSGPRAPVPPRTGGRSVVRWNEGDQKRIYDSFDWQKPPTTVQVQLAQEEIWMYQILCDIVRDMNAKATGGFDATIPVVQELAVGYLAAEDRPWGFGEGRVMRVKSASGQPMEPALQEPSGGEGLLTRPSHPRFGESGGSRGAAAVADGEAAASDDVFRNWIYVGLDGRPLMAADLSASLARRVFHFVPFRLRAVIDQRRLDDLLVRLATSAIPIDVRQVRVNPGSAVQSAGGDSASAASAAGTRRFDITVDIRGSIALAGIPDPKAILGDLPEQEPAEGGSVPATNGEPAHEEPAGEGAEPAPVEEAPAAPPPAEAALHGRTIRALATSPKIGHDRRTGREAFA